MKVKTLLVLFCVIVIAGLSCAIGLGLLDTDTDIKESNVKFYEVINVINVRQHPDSEKLFLIVYEEYFPECGCYEETTITLDPLKYRSQIENLNIPKTIRISGTIINNVYNIETMEN